MVRQSIPTRPPVRRCSQGGFAGFASGCVGTNLGLVITQEDECIERGLQAVGWVSWARHSGLTTLLEGPSEGPPGQHPSAFWGLGSHLDLLQVCLDPGSKFVERFRVFDPGSRLLLFRFLFLQGMGPVSRDLSFLGSFA